MGFVGFFPLNGILHICIIVYWGISSHETRTESQNCNLNWKSMHHTVYYWAVTIFPWDSGAFDVPCQETALILISGGILLWQLFCYQKNIFKFKNHLAMKLDSNETLVNLLKCK